MSIKSPRLRRKSRSKSPKKKVIRKRYFDIINSGKTEDNIIYLIRTHKNEEIWISEENLKKLGRHFSIPLKNLHNLKDKELQKYEEISLSELIAKIS